MKAWRLGARRRAKLLVEYRDPSIRVVDIAARFKVSVGYVSALARRAGAPMRKRLHVRSGKP